ncbi:MAG: c-type cytochrome [Chloroflexi bacterium]|nr:c-type cytochrome [Chloroflexota bacterium]
MKKIFKWIGIVLGSLVGLILLAAATLYFVGVSRANKVYDFPPSGIVILTDSESIARGKHIAEVTCLGCHGKDLGGVSPFFAIEGVASMDAPNLTTGQGGLGSIYSDEDFVRAIRHGINREGKANSMPPVPYFQYMSDEDLGSVIAYIRSVPPVDHIRSPFQAEPLGYILFAAGMFGDQAVNVVSHQNNIAAPEPAVTVEYGEYILRISACQDCHGVDLAGGAYPDPSIVYTVPNITPGSEVGEWTEEEFLKTIRTRINPAGRGLNTNLMPFDDINNLTDDELRAIFLYLQSLPALEQAPGQ